MSSTRRALGVFYTCALIAALAGIIRPELALMQLLFGQHIPIMHRLAMHDHFGGAWLVRLADN